MIRTDCIRQRIHNTSPSYEYFFSDGLQHPASAATHFLKLAQGNRIMAQFPFLIEMTSDPQLYLMLYTFDGKGVLSRCNTQHILESNTLIFLPCSEPYRLEICHGSHWNFKYAYITGSQITAYYDLYMESADPICTLINNHTVDMLMDRLIASSRLQSKASALIQNELITRLLTEAVIACQHAREALDGTPPYIFAVKQQLDADFASSFSLEQLARRHHVSKGKLIRDFKHFIGDSPISYLIQRRIESAKSHLCETDEPVYEIAASVGIENINHFTNLFKRSEGITPAAYRKINRSPIARLRA